MDSLVTQGLIGLVFVLSIALWSKSSSSSSEQTLKTSSTTAKKNKKKKKSGVGSQSDTAQAAISKSEQDTNTLEAQAASGNGNVRKEEEDNKAKDGVVNGKPNKKKGGDGAARKKMSLKDFTNEERLQELERQAKGDAGEADLGRDMIDRDLEPETVYKKVARIEPASQPTIYTPSKEPGWENVGGKVKAPAIVASKKVAEAPSNAWAASNPFAALPGSGADLPRLSGKSGSTSTSSAKASNATSSNTLPSGSSGGAPLTKKQRQNAAKAQAKKGEKEAMEADRLAKLAQHKKQVEAERMKEFYKKQSNGGTSAPASSSQKASIPAAPQRQRSMPKASINETGSLVWD